MTWQRAHIRWHKELGHTRFSCRGCILCCNCQRTWLHPRTWLQRRSQNSHRRSSWQSVCGHRGGRHSSSHRCSLHCGSPWHQSQRRSSHPLQHICSGTWLGSIIMEPRSEIKRELWTGRVLIKFKIINYYVVFLIVLRGITRWLL